MKRNHFGPGDFYGDRYNSKVVVLLLSGLSCVSCCFFTMMEWLAMKDVFGILLKDDVDPDAVRLILTVSIHRLC